MSELDTMGDRGTSLPRWSPAPAGLTSSTRCPAARRTSRSVRDPSSPTSAIARSASPGSTTLIAMKRAAGRPQDVRDIATLTHIERTRDGA